MSNTGEKRAIYSTVKTESSPPELTYKGLAGRVGSTLKTQPFVYKGWRRISAPQVVASTKNTNASFKVSAPQASGLAPQADFSGVPPPERVVLNDSFQVRQQQAKFLPGKASQWRNELAAIASPVPR